MLDVCLSVVLAFHLIAVNVAAAGPLLCVWLEWRESRQADRAAGWAGRYLAGASLILFLAGSLIGVVSAALLGMSGRVLFFKALAKMPGKIHYGAWELLFYLACMAAYVAWWRWSTRPQAWQRGLHRLLAILAATNLLWHFPPLFLVVSQLASAAELPAEKIDAAAFRTLMFQPEIFSQTVHLWLASFVTAGVFLAGGALGIARKSQGALDGSGVVAWASGVALAAAAAQLPVGLWVMVALPAASQRAVMGSDIWGSVLLIAGIFAALALMHSLAAAAMKDRSAKATMRAMTLFLLVMLLMVGTRQRLNCLARPAPQPPAAASDNEES